MEKVRVMLVRKALKGKSDERRTRTGIRREKYI